MTSPEVIRFPGHACELAARLHRAVGAPRATALFAHCFTCSKDLKAAVAIADALAERGIDVLRFDFTGLGDSSGDFTETTFSSDVEDLVAAADYLRREHAAPRILVGHSLGGAAVLAAALRIDEVAAVATIGAPADPSHVQHLFQKAQTEIDSKGEAQVTLAGRVFTIKKSFLEDLSKHALTDRVRDLRKALLILHAPRDEIVGINNAGDLFQAARHPKSFISLDGADHLLTNHAAARYAASVIAAWSERYVPETARAATNTVSVRTGKKGFATSITAGGHTLRADEPATVGGTDTGPTPYGLLLSALGSCTSMTLRMYADRKKWPLDAVEVELHHERIHASDCDECDTKTGRVDRIDRVLQLEGDLDAEQRSRLLEIADKCPVHRTLRSEVQILSRLAGSESEG